MKILFATNQSHIPQSAGGSESSTHDLCIALNELGIETAVLATLVGNKDKTWLKNRIKNKFTGNDFPIDRSLGYKVFRGWNVVNGAKLVVERFHPNIVVIQAVRPLALANKLVDTDIKIIIYLRDVEFHTHGGEYKPHRNLKFIANSQFTANEFFKNFGLKAKVLHPLVAHSKYEVISNRNKVLFINPIDVKGVDIAFKLAENNPGIPFLFVESWPISDKDRSELLTRAVKSKNIEWMKKQLDMKSVYSQAKIVLVPSRCNEAWGRIVTEAQISGIPALSSNRGGLPESVSKAGILLDPDDPFEKWQLALNKLWFDEDYYKQLSKKAKENLKRRENQKEYIMKEFCEYIENW